MQCYLFSSEKDNFSKDPDNDLEENKDDEKSGLNTTVLAILLGLLIVGIMFFGFL